MKYNKKLLSDLQELPLYLADNSISYKQWKKYMKKCDKCDCLEKLKNECRRIENVFNHKSKHPFCCNTVNISTKDQVRFAEINAMTVTKIAKKLDKICQADSKTWLQNIKKQHEYNFLGGGVLENLRYKIENAPFECSICFEIKTSFLILVCGHSLCLDCAFEIGDVSWINGLWFNKIANSKQPLDCPFCRFPKAIKSTTKAILIEK